MSWNNVIPAELLVSDSMIKSTVIENPLVTIPLPLLGILLRFQRILAGMVIE